MPVNATRFLRKMRGGAQAHLLATDAPGPAPFYVTKFTNNPQHRRILVNEWLGAHLLAALGIATPRVAVITVSPAFLAASPEVYLETGSARAPVPPGWHLGSQFPGDPLTEAVYDYLPDSLLPSVANYPDFLGVLVFDKWCGNADARQAIFLRRRLRDWLPQSDPSSPKKGFIAQMIDHGYLFDGPNWCYRDAPLQGFYPRPTLYAAVRSLDDFEPWLSRVRHCPESAIDDALRSLPTGWLDGDDDALSALLEQLLRRRNRVPGLLLDAIRARPNFFPSWRG
ncbi:MAG TPA: hypothetical protein PLF84_15825 [Bryobacteraceae bacterium]|nr:hypothetical protein [Bryobacterales bacterium]HRJ20519.1 hypothetical protein [Bryobacteraceae bacterium]